MPFGGGVEHEEGDGWTRWQTEEQLVVAADNGFHTSVALQCKDLATDPKRAEGDAG